MPDSNAWRASRTDKAIIDRRICDFAGEELLIIADTLTGNPPGTTCNAVMVTVMHQPDGSHKLAVISDGQRDTQGIADLLIHAAAHVHGGCDRCRRANRRAGRHRD
jgi:hypothetical protein